MESDKLCIKIDPELNIRFREKVLKTYGVQRGSLTRCIEEAIEQWIDRDKKELENENSDLTSGNFPPKPQKNNRGSLSVEN